MHRIWCPILPAIAHLFGHGVRDVQVVCIPCFLNLLSIGGFLSAGYVIVEGLFPHLDELLETLFNFRIFLFHCLKLFHCRPSLVFRICEKNIEKIVEAIRREVTVLEKNHSKCLAVLPFFTCIAMVEVLSSNATKEFSTCIKRLILRFFACMNICLILNNLRNLSVTESFTSRSTYFPSLVSDQLNLYRHCSLQKRLALTSNNRTFNDVDYREVHSWAQCYCVILCSAELYRSQSWVSDSFAPPGFLQILFKSH